MNRDSILARVYHQVAPTHKLGDPAIYRLAQQMLPGLGHNPADFSQFRRPQRRLLVSCDALLEVLESLIEHMLLSAKLYCVALPHAARQVLRKPSLLVVAQRVIRRQVRLALTYPHFRDRVDGQGKRS